MSAAGTQISFESIVFAGGRSRRLGGIDKAEIVVRGERLVDRAVSAARRAGASRVTVVGPNHLGAHADAIVREDPPFGGPLAALAAAMQGIDSPWVMLLPCDLVEPTQAAAHLTGIRSEDPNRWGNGWVLCDETGHVQWLSALIRVAPLRFALDEKSSTAGGAPREVLGALELQRVQAPRSATNDIDTPEHLAEAQALPQPDASTT